MTQIRDYVFVFWGDKFEEATAAIFVSELRRAGLRVKVVGLTPPRIRGVHGLILIPDLTLDEALPLADQAICLVVPYTSAGLKRLKNDPRLGELFERAHTNKAKFVIGPTNGTELVELGLYSTWAVDQVITYPKGEDVVLFARELAHSL